MAIFFAAMAILLAIAVAVLLTPISIEFRADKSADIPKIHIATHLRWLGFDIPFGGTSSPQPHVSSRRRVKPDRRIVVLVFSPGFLARGGRLIRELAALTSPSQVEIDARVGLDDPADTGMLLGWLSVRSFTCGRHRIHVEPDFSDSVLAGHIRVSWSTNVATMTWPLLKFMMSPVVWRAVRNYRAVERRAL